MKTPWVNPKIIIGNTAIGDYYFPRPDIEQAIWEEIEKGNHVLLAAPRRVGKSSVMQAMMEKPPQGTQCVFKNIQGIKSEAEYYEEFYSILVQCLSRFGKSKAWLKNFVKGINIEEISLDGVKFREKKSIDFPQAIQDLLSAVNQNNISMVLLLDELPEVLNKLYANGQRESASNILDHLRALRQTPSIRRALSFVLAGSVGIHHVVKVIEGRVADLNDFNPVPFEALTRAEANDYIIWATNSATVQYSPTHRDVVLDYVQHYIPYFINLMLDEINKTARKHDDPVISNIDIENAFAAIVKNSDHFKDWKNRLNDYFVKEEAAFLRETLVHTAHEGRIKTGKIYDLAVKHSLIDTYMELVQGLERDGYIQERGDHYAFISPFLQEFWKRDNPIYTA